MALSDGGDTKFRCGFGNEGTPPSVWRGFRVREGETLTGTAGIIADDSIRGSGEESPGLPGKIPVGGGLPFNFHAEDHHPFIASFFGAGATPAESPTGVWTHRYSVSQADDAFDPLWVEAWKDQSRAELFPACIPQQIEFALSPNGLLTGSVNLVGSRIDHYSEAVELAATGSPSAPVLRGTPVAAVRDAADPDFFVKVSAIVGDVVTFTGKVGAAAAYSATFDVTVGNNDDGDPRFDDVADEAGAAVGTDLIPVQLHLASATGLTVADEWRFDYPRVEPTIVLPTEAAFSEVLAQIYVDAAVFETREIGCTMVRPATPDEVIGGRFHPRVAVSGIRTTEWTITRRARQSDYWWNKVLDGAAVGLRLVARGPYIGATGIRRQWIIRSLNCQFTDTPVTGQVNSATDKTDSLTLRAYPSTDGTFPDAVTVDVINSIADITA